MQYHKTQHASLFTSLPEVQQYVRRYVQGHTQALDLPGLPAPAYDGTTELWFDTAEDIAKVFTSADYLRLIRPDEAKFLDLAGCGFLVLAENRCYRGSSKKCGATLSLGRLKWRWNK